MSDATDDEQADESGGPLAELPPTTRAVVIGAGVALVAIVIAAQRDVATQAEDRLRGPRWLWKAVATTPPGVLIYGLVGTRGPNPPFPDLPPPEVHVEAV